MASLPAGGDRASPRDQKVALSLEALACAQEEVKLRDTLRPDDLPPTPLLKPCTGFVSGAWLVGAVLPRQRGGSTGAPGRSEVPGLPQVACHNNTNVPRHGGILCFSSYKTHWTIDTPRF